MAVDRDKVLQAAQKLVERKRFDKAILEYQKLVADDPKDVRTLLKIGDLYLKTDEYVDAITTYERVGEFYSGQGFALKAIAVYKQIREIINKYVPHLSDRFGHIVPRLAELYVQLGLTSDALATYDEVATRLQKAGRERDAIDVFRKIVELDPSNPLPYLRLAEALVRIKDFDTAIQRFGTAAEILLKHGRRDDALKVLERLLQQRPDARFARLAAEIYLDRGDPNDGMVALQRLQTAFKENPKDLQTLTLLARAFDLLNQPAKAIEVQKAAARTAKEAGRSDQFAAIVTSLRTRAPNDEEVRQLAAHLQPAQPASTQDPRASIDVEVEDSVAEEIDLDPDEEPEEVRAPVAPVAHAYQRPAPPAFNTQDPAAMAHQIIGQADGLLRARQINRAIGLLRTGVQRLPSDRSLRERLHTALYEDAQDQDGAIQEMLAFAEMLLGENDVDAAVQKLNEVLLLDGECAPAIEMLAALGYTEAVEAQHIYPDAYQQSVAPEAAYSPEGLPSYDPEAVDPAQAISQDYRRSVMPSILDDLDDPFKGEPLPSFPLDPPASQQHGAPLPHFPLEPEQAHFDQPIYASVAPGMPSQPPFASYRPPPSQGVGGMGGMGSQSAPPPTSGGSRAEALDEDALEEAEFFAQHQMYGEARTILHEQLARLPNHPLLLERLSELDGLEHQANPPADNQSGTRPRPAEGQEAEQGDWIDIIGNLDNLDSVIEEPPPAAASDQVSAEEIFNQFKDQLKEHVKENDSATHYDLGVAYKEMGLLPDAIKEFALAARDPARECVCQSMIGVIHLETNNIDGAIDAFILGLRAPQKTLDQELALNYEIACAYEMRSDRDQALYYFHRVSRLNASYNDPRGAVADRIRRLEAPKPVARAAVGADPLGDDFDAAFDDLLSRAKLP
ncbi:tetratricopeptide repeat protein [Chondromyces apiculatus]|uniref:TPR repeat protein n=1 Tax=Chondromyces apiculatus DSM 436 TaxID=1192034 RepID=A0A017TJM4_9BACT|nr:tetratricopeptide repeat protein [Chondromyces apiculatus]EYF08851.1 TPR repeat protein [Chondromyces apiculatus DSM 436]